MSKFFKYWADNDKIKEKPNERTTPKKTMTPKKTVTPKKKVTSTPKKTLKNISAAIKSPSSREN